MKVLVCGGRDYCDEKYLNGVLNYFHESSLGPITFLVEGGAKGADFFASKWRQGKKIPGETIHANWPKYGTKAGMIRNQQMLDLHPDTKLVIAFPTSGPGTYGMMSLARKAGVTVINALEDRIAR